MSSPAAGYLEKNLKGFGFLRKLEKGLAKINDDTFVPADLINKYRLEDGTYIEGISQINQHHAPCLIDIHKLNGLNPNDFHSRTTFSKGTPIIPNFWLKLEGEGSSITNRVVDIVAPIGKGQRALIAAPPRSGKTILLENMISAIMTNYPSMTCIILLIDERPEEVTHFKRLFPKAVIIASSSDENSANHITLARQVFAIAKTLTEMKKDVVIFMDSLTRLCRAFNSLQKSSRTLSGGIDADAMTEPKKMFGSARQIEYGGSLTIIATVLIETDSQMDEVIFREFKGTGNMEIILDRNLAEKNIFPAINIRSSGTRNEKQLWGESLFEKMNLLHSSLADCNKEEALTRLIQLIKRHPTNKDFLKLQS